MSRIPLISADNIHKKFGITKAVNDLSFHAHRGEIVGVMGPNGAGKSTTMRILAGFIKPDSGTVVIEDIDVVKRTRDAQRAIGYLPENGGIYEDLTVKEYLEFIARSYDIGNKKDCLRAIDAIAVKTHCDTFLNRCMQALSKGMRQRVFLAGALIHNPTVLILDEPTDGLDPNQKHEMRELLLSLKSDKTIILSTHILEEAEAICDRVVVVNKGSIIADETPKELAARTSGDIQKAFRQLTTPTDSE